MKTFSGIGFRNHASVDQLPAWRISLLLFGLLVTIVLSYFYWQVRQLQHTFLTHSLEHSRMLANVIEQNARTAVLSQKAVEKIVQIFLGNSSRFVAYLDAIEPFSTDELTAFAHESGLSGIRIVRADGTVTQGPEDFDMPAVVNRFEINGEVTHFPDKNLYVATSRLLNKNGYVITALTSALIGQLNEEISLRRLLESLTGMAGIRYVRVEKKTVSSPDAVAPAMSSGSNDQNPDDPSRIHLIRIGEETIAESRIPFGDEVLVAGMDTRYFLMRTRQIWFEFFFFAGVLAVLGISFSYILHRIQTRYLMHIQAAEREMAAHREDASLGRAAAAIAHEIRNPLNAIGMGLQRLQIEVPDLTGEYRDLITTLLQAVQRTNLIVSDIRRHAHPAAPAFAPVSPSAILEDILALYRAKCHDQSIEIIQNLPFTGTVAADPQMLAQMMENLVKNAIEAQPDGGYLNILLDRQDRYYVLTFENRGFTLPESETGRVMAPYFTTKARGTGLGLSIVQKIVQAHNGRLKLRVPESGTLRVEILLPIASEKTGTDHEDSDR